jgi:hypothetical protein
MRVSEEAVFMDIFRKNPVFTSLHLRSPVHVVPPLSHIYKYVPVYDIMADTQSTYVYRVQSCVWRLQNIDPSPSFYPASLSSPRTKGGGYTLAWWLGVGGGSIFWKTPDIGLASYSIIPLRADISRDRWSLVEIRTYDLMFLKGIQRESSF